MHCLMTFRFSYLMFSCRRLYIDFDSLRPYMATSVSRVEYFYAFLKCPITHGLHNGSAQFSLKIKKAFIILYFDYSNPFIRGYCIRYVFACLDFGKHFVNFF